MNVSTFDWRSVPENELERQFNPRVAVPDYATYLESWAVLGQQARRHLDFRKDIRYGSGPRQLLDVIPALVPDAPAVIYVHGGFWRALSKDSFAGVAGALHPHGVTTVLVGYDLCPDVSLDRQVEQISEALDWCVDNLESYGVDSTRMVVAGSSAGAHLLAMNIFRVGARIDRFAGACLSSGIYDVRPVMRISVNNDIRLDEAGAIRNSPLDLVRWVPVPMVIAVGGIESPAWIGQSREFSTACQSVGCSTQLLEIPGAHHFSVGLGRPGTIATNALLELLGLRTLST